MQSATLGSLCLSSFCLSVSLSIHPSVMLCFCWHLMCVHWFGLKNFFHNFQANDRLRTEEEGDFVYPYNLGWRRNLQQVFTWSGKPKTDGFTWNVIDSCTQYTLTVSVSFFTMILTFFKLSNFQLILCNFPEFPPPPLLSNIMNSFRAFELLFGKVFFCEKIWCKVGFGQTSKIGFPDYKNNYGEITCTLLHFGSKGQGHRTLLFGFWTVSQWILIKSVWNFTHLTPHDLRMYPIDI